MSANDEAALPWLRQEKRLVAAAILSGKAVLGICLGAQLMAAALGARTVLFQCPAKFTQTDENIARLRQFFTTRKRKKLNFAWEPRGGWDAAVVRELCKELDLWHAVDPFKTPTVTPDRCYYRLHGVVRWRYTYEDGELEELVSLLPDSGLSYVFFNNITMFEDALRFEKILKER